MSQKICLPVGRVVYAHLEEPSSPPGTDKEFYSVTLSFPADTDVSKIEAALQAAAEEKWGNKVPKKLTLALKENDVDQLNEDDELRFGFHEGGYSITLKQEKKKDITFKALDKSRIESDQFYAGCWVQAIANLHAYKVQDAGVTAYLKGLRFVRDDDPLGGGTSDEDFDDLPDGGEGDEDIPF